MTTLAQIGEELLARRRRHLRAREADGVEAQRQRTFADRHLQIAGGQCISTRLIRGRPDRPWLPVARSRSEEHTSELQSLMRISYAVFCLKKKKDNHNHHIIHIPIKSRAS